MRSVALAAGALVAFGTVPSYAQQGQGKPADTPHQPIRATAASSPVTAQLEDFDLADHGPGYRGNGRAERVRMEDALATAPEMPRGMIIEGGAPSVEYVSAEGGPVLGVGAFGRNGRDVPRLAHVRLGWQF